MIKSISPKKPTKKYRDDSESVRNAVYDGVQEENRPIPDSIIATLRHKQFTPHPLFYNGHAQTILASAWPRFLTTSAREGNEERLFEIEPDVRLLAHCNWQSSPIMHPTLLLVHGLEGSSSSKYMLGTADKAFAAGFNIIRLNMRNCGGTEHLTPTLYHSGMSGDLRIIAKELIERDQLPSIFLIGFSMGGNLVLKLAGEEANTLPEEVSGFCAVSPAIDLSSCVKAIRYRSNWVYEQMFLRSLRRRLRIKHALYPNLYDTSDLHLVRTIRDFDERYTAHHGGFADADDYYSRASALPLIEYIRRPTLIIHAQDDPFIPFEPFNHSSVNGNPHVLLLAPERGGHVGFVSGDANELDRFWAENRLVDFCKLVAE